MPVKIRELIRELKMAGFVDRGGKRSHRNFMHASGVIVTISGHPGDDAKLYQIKVVREKIEETRK
jgi:predicted RNA binding protein YcfA (HicA-like mRNA interferase family)